MGMGCNAVWWGTGEYSTVQYWGDDKCEMLTTLFAARPKEFSKQTGDFDNGDDSGDESSDAEDDGRGGQGKNVGEMPPSESDDDDEGDDNEDDGKHAAHDSWRAARAEVVYKTADEEPRRSKR